jgi:hypothetical protein
MGTRNINKIPGTYSKNFHFVFFSNQKKKAAIADNDANSPNGECINGTDCIFIPLFQK